MVSTVGGALLCGFDHQGVVKQFLEFFKFSKIFLSFQNFFSFLWVSLSKTGQIRAHSNLLSVANPLGSFIALGVFENVGLFRNLVGLFKIFQIFLNF